MVDLHIYICQIFFVIPGGNVAPGPNRGDKIDKPDNSNKPSKPENSGTEDKDDKKANKANKGTHIYTYDELNRMVSSNIAKETYHKAAPPPAGAAFPCDIACYKNPRCSAASSAVRSLGSVPSITALSRMSSACPTAGPGRRPAASTSPPFTASRSSR